MTSAEDTARPFEEQDQIERAQRFYAAAEVARELGGPSPTRLEWRRVLLTLIETEKVLRQAHDMLIAEQEIRFRDDLDGGFRAELNRLHARIADVRAILVADQP